MINILMLLTLQARHNVKLQQFNVIFLMWAGKEGAVVALLAVDVWPRYVAVAPLKRRKAQTVGQALVKFISDVRTDQLRLPLTTSLFC